MPEARAEAPFGLDVSPRKVAVVRALRLGDLLSAVPVLRALRAALPGAEIVLVGLPSAQAFVERFDRYLDGLLALPGFPGLPEAPPRPADIPAFLARAHELRFDLAIQLHGSGGVTNPLTVLLGARVNAGFYVPGAYCPDEERFLPYPEGEPELRRGLRLMQFLGVPLRGEELEFPLHAADREELGSLDGAGGLRTGEYVCIHAGASSEERRWEVERFAAVADDLAARGLRVVLTGVAAEAGLAGKLARLTRSRPLVLAGRTSLGALAALLAGSRLLVANDTGVAHLATALRVPSVVLFDPARVERWAPLDRTLHRVVERPAPLEAVLRETDDLLAVSEEAG